MSEKKLNETKSELNAQINKVENPALLSYLLDLLKLASSPDLNDGKKKALASIFSGIDVLAGNYDAE